MKIAILGTRGIPANYGGFETFAQELSRRLVQRGHEVSVYCRNHYVRNECSDFEGVRLIRYPSIQTKYLDTVVHTAISVVDSVFRGYDAVLICNAANAFLSWVPRIVGQKVVINVDGIERLRKKWNRVGKEFYHVNEWFATKFPNQIVTDARAIESYYEEHYSCPTRFIPYGASTEPVSTNEVLSRLGLEEGKYFLYVSRLEPENNAYELLTAYIQSKATMPLALVGHAPYSRKYIQKLKDLARSANVIMPGAIYGQGYRELQAHAYCYLHGAEVGGTHPALLEAMGTRSLVIANDTPQNREVVGDSGLLCPFGDRDKLARLLLEVEQGFGTHEHLRNAALERVRKHYDWERVTDMYEELFNALA